MGAGSQRPPLSAGQWEIMQAVWDGGEVTVAEVWKALAARRPVARNTVQTLLTRLAEKGWLRCRTDGHAHRYRAAVPRAAALKGAVRRLVDTAFGGSAAELVHALLDGRGVSPAEAARIRELIERAERGQQP
jgi:predicted transcriptional regulator